MLVTFHIHFTFYTAKFQLTHFTIFLHEMAWTLERTLFSRNSFFRQ